LVSFANRGDIKTIKGERKGILNQLSVFLFWGCFTAVALTAATVLKQRSEQRFCGEI